MRAVQHGDRVQVHFVKRLQNGTVTSSRGRLPLEVTVGVNHPRLPGLGEALVGLTPGARTTVEVAPEHAYGLHSPDRIGRLARTRFTEHPNLAVGQTVRITNRRGRRRLLRVLRMSDRFVVVDVNHPWAGQSLVLEVELVAICPEADDLAL
ncbi:MAG: FKBP-type peptidyl-prolyl cis-trans isomerase [Gemmataceae bacterium]|nr:FKBP-type peptidyl-prolyl cis-trans isomerase [Gemmataceae bacterium]